MKSAGSGFPYHPTYPQRIAATFHVGLSIRHQVDQVIFVRIAIESAELSFVVDNNKCQLCYRIITSRNGLWIWFGCMRITCDNSGIRILCCVRMRCGASFFFQNSVSYMTSIRLALQENEEGKPKNRRYLSGKSIQLHLDLLSISTIVHI